MQELGDRIRQLRVARGLSQAELGDGRYSGSYISHIESGRRRPGAEVLGFIAERLSLAASDLDPDTHGPADADVAALLAGVRRHMQAHQWDAAVLDARQASRLADELRRESRRWEADFLLASALMASGRYEEAASLGVDLAQRRVVATIGDLRAEVRTLASRALRACGRLADASDQAALAASDARQGEQSLLAAALIAQLAALVIAARWDEAVPIEAQLCDLVDGLDAPDAAKAAWALGSTSFSRGDLAAGLAWHSRGAQLSDPSIDPLAWARLHQSTAHYLVTMDGDPDEAQTHADRAQPIVMLMGSPGDIADLRLVQARLLLRRGQTEQAVRLLEHLAEEAAILDDGRLEADVRDSLATGLAVLGRTREARQELRLAAMCFEKAQAPHRALEMWHRYAAAEESQV